MERSTDNKKVVPLVWSGVLARLVMLWWDKEFTRKAREFEIDILMYLRFVADANIAT